MQNTPDHILIEKIQKGNKVAFDNLFFKYYKPLYRFTYNFCKDTSIAEESVQKTFIKIWQNNSHKEYLENIGNVIFTYAKNEVIDELRKLKARKKYEENAFKEFTFENSNNQDEKLIVKAIIESAIEQLPKKSKEIFRLAKQEGLSINEISKYLDLSKKTIENQLTIAYKKLRQYLQPFKNQLTF